MLLLVGYDGIEAKEVPQSQRKPTVIELNIQGFHRLRVYRVEFAHSFEYDVEIRPIHNIAAILVVLLEVPQVDPTNVDLEYRSYCADRRSPIINLSGRTNALSFPIGVLLKVCIHVHQAAEAQYVNFSVLGFEIEVNARKLHLDLHAEGGSVGFDSWSVPVELEEAC